eukprot:6407515-Alexandrium_andersonii.AAC.1
MHRTAGRPSLSSRWGTAGRVAWLPCTPRSSGGRASCAPCSPSISTPSRSSSRPTGGRGRGSLPRSSFPLLGAS